MMPIVKEITLNNYVYKICQDKDGTYGVMVQAPHFPEADIYWMSKSATLEDAEAYMAKIMHHTDSRRTLYDLIFSINEGEKCE